jgi:hypothetical protein
VTENAYLLFYERELCPELEPAADLAPHAPRGPRRRHARRARGHRGAPGALSGFTP